MDELSRNRPEELKVIVLDNGAFHQGKTLKIPDNIALIFLPSHSPELNPAELVWLNMKRKMTNKIYKTMDELKLELKKNCGKPREPKSLLADYKGSTICLTN